MPEFSLSRQAKSDVLNITRYTVDHFGLHQARSYHDSMTECFNALADNHGLGKAINYVGTGYRQYNHKSHVIFYKSEGEDIFIIRVLHKSMNAPQHL